jgi:fibronectin-binding autotransporter adhesin
MANYFARKAANVNATDVWATTPTGTAADVFSTFTSSDVLHSNNFAITVNVDTTVGEVRNDNANSATAGGSFTLNNGITLTADAFAGSTGTTCVIYSGITGNSANFVGNAVGGSANNAVGIRNASTGVLNVTGNTTGGTIGSSHGSQNAEAGTLNITGNVTGGSSSFAHGLINTFTGNVNIVGNAVGGSTAGAFGAQNTAGGTIDIVGSAIASSVSSGANNSSTGTLIATRAVGNNYGIGAAGGTGVAVGLRSANIASDSRVEELEYGPNGAPPTEGAVKVVSGTNNKCLVTLTTSAVKTLADPSDGTGQANEADVRSGTSYALGNKTGTCAVPAAGSVALGVAVDATTGTAVLTPAAVWDALTSGMTTAGSIGARLKNAATLDSTGQQLADALSPVP